MNRKGILLAGGTGTRLFPMTMAVSKQLMPVYDKPLIYYPLSVLMLTGIREILVITTPEHRPHFQHLLGDGSAYGLKLSYVEQPQPKGIAQALILAKDFLGPAPALLVLGDNLFYGHDLVKSLRAANQRTKGATIFGYHVTSPAAYGVVEFSATGQVRSIEEKPTQPKSNYAVPGIYFYDHQAVGYAQKLKPSKRGELEITDLNRCYLKRGQLRVEVLGRGTAWLDTGTPDTLLDAAHFVQVIEKRQGLKIACLEEIALRNGWISEVQLQRQIAKYGSSTYAGYLRSLL